MRTRDEETNAALERAGQLTAQLAWSARLIKGANGRDIAKRFRIARTRFARQTSVRFDHVDVAREALNA